MLHKQVLLLESFQNTSQQKYHVLHTSDDVFRITKIDIDRSFQQLRRDVFFEKYKGQFKNYFLAIDAYVQNKKNMKVWNKQLHLLFWKKKTVNISYILTFFSIAEIVRNHNIFNLNLSDGKFLTKNGNEICFLGCNSDAYFLIEWNGS